MHIKENNNMDLQENIQNNPTIFGKILRGEIPANKVYEDDQILAFHDIAPKAKVHVLVIPKKHIVDVRSASAEDAELLSYMMLKLPEIADMLGIKESGFRIIANNGEESGQEVPHLHFHILGGEKLGALIG